MNIAAATPEDIEQLNKLINGAYRGEQSKAGWTTEADLLDGIRTDEQSLQDLIATPGAVFLKYIENDIILGCVYLEKDKDKMYLGMLTVSPGEQAKGIGKNLLAASEKYALEQQCTFIEMTVISARKELIAWYEKMGFLNTGQTKPFPDDVRFGIPKQPLEFIVMQKKIRELVV